jgi:hypothetical protein
MISFLQALDIVDTPQYLRREVVTAVKELGGDEHGCTKAA